MKRIVCSLIILMALVGCSSTTPSTKSSTPNADNSEYAKYFVVPMRNGTLVGTMLKDPIRVQATEEEKLNAQSTVIFAGFDYCKNYSRDGDTLVVIYKYGTQGWRVMIARTDWVAFRAGRIKLSNHIRVDSIDY